MTVPLPTDGSVYSNPSFVKDVTEALLLSTDRKRLNEIGPVRSAEWSLAHAYQVLVNLKCFLWNLLSKVGLTFVFV